MRTYNKLFGIFLLVYFGLLADFMWGTRTEFPLSNHEFVVDAFISVGQPSSKALVDYLYFISKKTHNKIRIQIYNIVAYDMQKDIFLLSDNKKLLEENFRHAYINSKFPEKYLEYMFIRNLDFFNPDWESSASIAGFAAGELKLLKNCSSDSDTVKLLKEYYFLSRKREVEQLPVVFINGYRIDISSEFASAFRYINKMLFRGDKPDNVITPVTIQVIVNPYGPGGNISQGISFLRTVFPFSDIKVIDSDSSTGKILIKEYDIETLPAFLIKKKKIVSQEADIRNKVASLVSKGDFLDRKGKDFYVLSNERIGLRLYFRRPYEERNLKIFLNGKSDEDIKILVDLLQSNRNKDDLSKIAIQACYTIEADTASIAGQGFGVDSSYNEELVRQAIIQKYFPDAFLPYLTDLRNKGSHIVSKSLKTIGISEDLFYEKIKSEGHKILFDNLRLAKELDVKSLPVFLWENRYLTDYDGLKEIPIIKTLKKNECKKCEE